MTKNQRLNTPKILIVSLLTFVLLAANFNAVFASDPADKHADTEEPFNPSETIVHHVLDDHIWHFFDGHYGTLYLPVIVYSSERGLEFMSSKNFYDDHHNPVTYKGYSLEHGLHYVGEGGHDDAHGAADSHGDGHGEADAHDNDGHADAHAEEGGFMLDLSITKNVLTLFINAAVLLLVFTAVARGYKKNKGKAPKGIQAVFEPIIIYLRDEVIKPNIGKNYEKYLPYLLTLFFFILFGNIIGLLPGAANMTGNIAVTLVMALFTFIITNVKGNKGYWGHIFLAPGVPVAPKPLIILVEVIGIFTKPISLTVRLFVAITAGHIVMLSLISLAFIFGSVAVGAASSLIVLFINLIEILVAGIQAYVFTMFSALYIGLATADHGDH